MICQPIVKTGDAHVRSMLTEQWKSKSPMEHHKYEELFTNAGSEQLTYSVIMSSTGPKSSDQPSVTSTESRSCDSEHQRSCIKGRTIGLILSKRIKIQVMGDIKGCGMSIGSRGARRSLLTWWALTWLLLIWLCHGSIPHSDIVIITAVRGIRIGFTSRLGCCL